MSKIPQSNLLPVIPPQDLAAEQAVLGSILIDNSVFLKVQEQINAEDFYKESHRHIFRAIEDQVVQGEPIDLFTLPEQLRKTDRLEEAGGYSYLVSLVDDLVTSASAGYYARIVRKFSLRRKAMALSQMIGEMSRDNSLETEEMIGTITNQVFSLGSGISNTEPIALREGIHRLVEDILYKTEESGIKTYFSDLDKTIGILTKQAIVTVVGFTGEGKTAFMDSIILRFVKKTGRPIWKWSGEMSLEECSLRYACMLARVSSVKLLAGYLNSSEMARLTLTLGQMSDMPIMIDTTGGITMNELKFKSLLIKMRYPNLGFIVIDNLPLMTLEGENEAHRFRKAMHDIRAFSKILNLPIFVITQYSYHIRRSDKRTPDNDDIYCGSAVIQDSTHVWHLFQEGEENRIKILKMGKQRYAPVGQIRLLWMPEFTLFEDLFSQEE